MTQVAPVPASPSASTSAIYDASGLSYQEAYAHDAGLVRAVEHFASLVKHQQHQRQHQAGSSLPHLPRVLDLGCGTGKPVASGLAAAGLAVHGIDFSTEMVALAGRQVPGATFEKADMITWEPGKGPEEETKFAGIVASLSLFWLDREQLEAMAAKWRRWLLPGGYVMIVMIPAEDYPLIKDEMYDTDGKYARNIPTMFMGKLFSDNSFTRAGWRAFLEENGFHVSFEKIDSFNPPKEAGSENEIHQCLVAQNSM